MSAIKPPIQEVGAVGAATSGVTAAALAGVSAACCTGPILAPLIVAVLGVGGAAWAASLKPYTPYLFALSGAILAFGFRTVYREPAVACAIDAPRPGLSARLVRGLLWLSLAIWVGSIVVAVYGTYFADPFSA